MWDLISSVRTTLRIIINAVGFVGIGRLLICTPQVLVAWGKLEEKRLGKINTRDAQL